MLPVSVQQAGLYFAAGVCFIDFFPFVEKLSGIKFVLPCKTYSWGMGKGCDGG